MLRMWLGKVGRLLIGNHSVPPFSKGGSGGIWDTLRARNSPRSPFFKGGRRLLLLLMLVVGLSGCDSTEAAERVALVIGNSGYAERPLKNPPNDAQAMTALLRKLGFTVTEKTDLTLAGFRQQVNAFLDQSKGAELRLFYYSGHGASYDGDNYLLPIGHGVTRKHELPDQAYSLKTLLRGFKEQSGVNLVLLDSCRDAPFGDAKSNWDDSKGMKPLQPKQTGVLIGYAADQGQTASDNWGGGNSLYTTHLLQHLGQSLELRKALMQVQQQVYAESHNQQLPMSEDRVLGEVYLAGTSSPPSPPPPPLPSPLPVTDYDLKQWESAEKCGTAACFQAYVDAANAQSRFVKLAKAQIDKLIPPVKPAPVAPLPDPNDAVRQEKLDFQLAIAEGFLAKNKISLARQALQDAKRWDRQGKVEAFRREQATILQATALALLQQGKRNAARQVLSDLKRWDPESAEYRALREQMSR